MGTKIVMSRVPLRVSFVGGGSDLPGGAGATVSTAIDKYVYVVAKWRYDTKVILNWRHREEVEKASDLRHDIAREILKMVGILRGIEITTFADISGLGSGLGSSAATTIGIIQAVSRLLGVELSKSSLVNLACKVELDTLKRKGGKQDQIACAHGGVNYVKYDSGGRYRIDTIDMEGEVKSLLPRHFHLFSPGADCTGRDSDDVLGTFSDSGDFRSGCIGAACGFREALELGDYEKMIKMTSRHEWLKSRAFPGYSCEKLKRIQQLTFRLPYAVKICGAGGAGHLLGAIPMELSEAMILSYSSIWGPKIDWSIDEEGARVLYEE